MSSLSAILRRLRAMPQKTLSKKLTNLPKDLNMGAIHGNDWMAAQLADMVQTTKGPTRARPIRGDDFFDVAADNRQSEPVMKILQRLQKRGVQGMPPRSRR